jgi:predicted Rossmann-fold nucleotide-binding protein
MTPTIQTVQRRFEIETFDDLGAALAEGRDLAGWVIHAIDLRGLPDLGACRWDGAIFLGCTFRDDAQRLAFSHAGAAIFPPLSGLPYDPYRTGLYTVQELMQGYDEGGYTATRDFQIYAHADRGRGQGLAIPVRETLAQTLHDHAISDALQNTLAAHTRDASNVIGVMGGHSTSRASVHFREVVRVCWSLTRAGYVIASGGGPGIMEAANLGAYLACWADPAVVDEALAILSVAPYFDKTTIDGEVKRPTPGSPLYFETIDRYVTQARAVHARFGPHASDADRARLRHEGGPPGFSIAVPTWFYGHEPSNLFSDHIAKFFANSIREDGLLAISLGGVIYAPGSAGTLQEVFMDLAQNFYSTFRWHSPMVFLGEDPVMRSTFALVQEFLRIKGASDYASMVAFCDDAAQAAHFIQSTPPHPMPAPPPLY